MHLASADGKAEAGRLKDKRIEELEAQFNRQASKIFKALVDEPTGLAFRGLVCILQEDSSRDKSMSDIEMANPLGLHRSQAQAKYATPKLVYVLWSHCSHGMSTGRARVQKAIIYTG